MAVNRRPTSNVKQRCLNILMETLCFFKNISFNTILFISVVITFFWFYYGCLSLDVGFSMPSFSFANLNSMIGMAETTTTTTESTTVEETTTPSEIFISMDDRKPAFMLATIDGKKPEHEGARGKLLDFFNFPESCKDSSLNTIVDIGAKLGDLGLYAGACGCNVGMFESDSDMTTLIQTSITANKFPETRVRVYNKYVGAQANSDQTVETTKLDGLTWDSSIFLVHIGPEHNGLNVLRSAEKLIVEKRIRQVVCYLDTINTDQNEKKELFNFTRKKLKAKRIYVFRPTEGNFYGPLNPRSLNEISAQKDEKRKFIGIYIVFDFKTKQMAVNAAQYDSNSFFS